LQIGLLLLFLERRTASLFVLLHGYTESFVTGKDLFNAAVTLLGGTTSFLAAPCLRVPIPMADSKPKHVY
jgi:hypothetical protein